MKPRMKFKDLHQGMQIPGDKEPNRRWIAVILDEQEIIEAARQQDIDPDALDFDYVARKYSDAMLHDWDETLKIIVDGAQGTA